jgi:flagellin-like protein
MKPSPIASSIVGAVVAFAIVFSAGSATAASKRSA